MPRYGRKYISSPDEVITSQDNLFVKPGGLNTFPVIAKNESDFINLLNNNSLLGIDFEFNTKKIKGKEYYDPTIIAVSSSELTVGCRYTKDLAWACVRYIERSGRFVAYSTLGADKPVLEQPLGITTPLEGWHDALLIHYFANQALTKTTAKEVSDDAGSLGYMNLWTAASLVTDLPLWKRCLNPHTQVLTENGWLPIYKLYKNNFVGKVRSLDVEGNLCWRTVTEIQQSPLLDRTYYRVSYKGNRKDRRAIITNDHQVLTCRGWTKAEDLCTEDYIATGTIEPVDKDLITGMWLGDSYLNCQGNFRIFNNTSQETYLKTKAQILEKLGKVCYYTRKYPGANPRKPLLNATLEVSPFFKNLREADYFQWCYEHFSIRSLALWFFDDGSRQDNRLELSCTGMPVIWAEKFANKISELIQATCYVHLGKTGPRLFFGVAAAKVLSALLYPYATEDVRYKLVPSSVTIPFDISNYEIKVQQYYAPVLVQKETSSYYNMYKTVYCLSVEETENFVTLGGVVHNCTGLDCYSSGRVCSIHKPIEYCAVDSWAGLMIYLEQWKKLKKFNFSYDFYRSKMALGEICTTMQTNGVKIDTKYVKEFDEKGEQKKELLFDFDLKPATKRAQKELERLQIPLTLTPEELREYTQKHLDDWQLDEDDFIRAYKHFNPRSPQEIVRYFKEHGIDLSVTDKKYLQKKLEQLAVSRGLDSISEIDDPDNVPEHLINLYNLWMLKNEGKGIKAWFGPQYVDEYDYAHPRWLYTGASSGRLSSSGPNFMNIPARGFGEQLRKAVIPRDPSLELYKADKSQLELRMVLHCAGVDQKILGPDAFVALVEQSGDDFYKAAKAYDPVKYEKDPRTAARNIAKVFSHSNSYLIGIKIIPYNELDSPRIKRDIDSGILAVYRKKYIPWLERDWEYGGGVVAFTGKHLAETAYGADTKENRKRALEMQENVYFKNDRWGVRRWQMKLLEFIETHGYAQHSCGSFLELYSSPVEAAKIAAGFIGQGQSAHYMQELMLNYRALGIMPLLQVHDELVFEQVKGRSDEEVKEFFGPMRAPSKLFDGFSAPIEIKRGPNWKDLQLVGKI